MFILKFFRRHLVASIIIVVASLASAGSVYAMSAQQQADEQKLREQTAAKNAEIDKQIAEHKKQIAAQKAKEKAEAEAKAKAEAAAKAKAEAAKKKAASQGSNTISCTAPAPGHSDPTSVSVVVNKKHCIQPLNFTPSDLVTVYGATISAKAQANFVAMYQAATAAGVPFRVTSSFRSYANQVSTYNYWVSVNGTAGADTVSARPGYSEHQTGLAMDLAAGSCVLECFAGTAQYNWLAAHAASYGFIERYPAGYTGITGYSPEAWHYRYVGVAVAKDMKARGIKTLEQYWGVSGGNY